MRKILCQKIPFPFDGSLKLIPFMLYLFKSTEFNEYDSLSFVISWKSLIFSPSSKINVQSQIICGASNEQIDGKYSVKTGNIEHAFAI